MDAGTRTSPAMMKKRGKLEKCFSAVAFHSGPGCRSDIVAASQALLFVVAIALGRCDVAILHVVVLAHLGRRFSGLVLVLDRGLGRSGVLTFLADSNHVFLSFIDRVNWSPVARS